MDCKEGTSLISKQIIDLLQQIDNKIYSSPLEIFNQSSIGQHFRHIIDFYNCLIHGSDKGVIDYCKRERNPLIETDTETAIGVLSFINTKVQQLDETKTVTVKTDFSSNEQINRTDINSSLGRELMYAFDHALHHLALIKIGFQVHYPSIKIDQNLGVAPSTIKYKNALKRENS